MKKYKTIPLSDSWKERFWSKVDIRSKTECWEWQACKIRDNYGAFGIKDQIFRPNRLAYFLHTGIDPKNKHVLHTCDNTSCVNPNHLFLGTDKDNSDDMIRKNRQVKIVGEQHWKAKLTEQQALEILESTESHKILSIKYNISKCIISGIQTRKIWKHLLETPKAIEARRQRDSLGFHLAGENHPKSKITKQDVIDIRKSNENLKTLSQRFNVGISCISAIRTHTTWKHIP